MRPVDQFFASVRDVFARNRSTDWTEIGAIALFGSLVVVGIAFWAGRWRTRRETSRRVAEVASRGGLGAADLAYLRRIADAANLNVLEVMTRLPTFERATAAALVVKVPPVHPVEGSGYERVRYLRKALGFSPLPAHHWLISTRELVTGDHVTVNGHSGRVVEVNEASFAVDLPVAVPVALGSVGALGMLAIARPDDSRYLARVRALGVEAPGQDGSRRFFFAHDERPERQQDRAYVRVRVSAGVTLRILDATDPASGGAASAGREGAGGGAGARNAAPAPAVQAPEPPPCETLNGSLVDVSAGGLSLKLEREHNVFLGDLGDWKSSRVLCSFELRDGQRFEDLAALVATVEPLRPAAQGFRLRLAFTGLPHATQDRLSAAVASEQRAPPPPEGLARILPLEDQEDDENQDGAND